MYGRFHAIRHGDLAVVYLGGVITATATAGLTRDVESLIDEGIRRFIFNMRDVRRLDSTSVGAIVGIQHRIESVGGRLIITRVPEELLDVFSISNLHRILHITAAESITSDAEVVIAPPPETLREELEETWKRLSESSDAGVEPLPEGFSDYLRGVDTRVRGLLDANQELQDLLHHGDLEIRHSEERHRHLFENAAEAILVIETHEGEIIRANQQALSLTGHGEKALLGKTINDLLPDLAGLSLVNLMTALRRRASQSAVTALHLRRADGSTIPVHIVSGELQSQGEPLIVIHMRDVSVFQEAEVALQEQVELVTNLNALERRLAGSRNPATLFRELASQVNRLLHTEESAVLALEPTLDRLGSVVIGERSGEGEGVECTDHEVSKPLESLRPLMAGTITAPLDPQLLRPLIDEGIIPREWLGQSRQWLSLTIGLGDDVGAVLILGRDGEWSDREISILQNLRTMGSLCLANATHIHEVERAHSEYLQIFQQSRDAIGVIDLTTGHVITANPQWEGLTGQHPDEAVGTPLINFVAEDDWSLVRQELRRLQTQGEGRWECRIANDSGGSTWVQVRGSLIQPEPAPLALLILIDITERRQRDQEIRSLSRITTSNPNLVLRVDHRGQVVYANPAVGAFLKRAGLAPEDLRALLPGDLVATINRLTHGPNRVETLEHTVGDRTLLCTLCVPVDDDSAILHGVEITAQKNLEQAIAESEANYRALVEGAIEGIAALRDGHLHTVNRRLCDITGRSADDLFGLALRELVHPDDWRTLAEELLRVTHGEISDTCISFRFVHAGGDSRDIEAAFVPTSVGPLRQIVGYFTDVTEQRRLEAELQQLQRIETIGKLAGGIAHDFNDVLTGVLGHAHLLQESLDEGSEAHRHAQKIDEVAERGRVLTSNLMTFARGDRIQAEVIDMAEIVEDSLEMLRRTLGRDITVDCEAPDEPAVVEIAPSHIRHILMCLGANAREAMERGGRLGIRLSSVVLGAPELKTLPGARPGPHVCLEVSDTGRGIPERDLPKIFDPLFTTKSGTKSAGLGLALVFGVVTHAGGSVHVESEIDRGTRVRIFLPRSERAPRRHIATGHRRARTGETLLVIDDEEIVRELTQEILADAGYEVITASNGAEGLDRYHEAQEQIRAILLDIMMPVMDGPTLFRTLRQEGADLPILLISGYSSEGEIQELLVQGRCDFLPKPFRREVLLSKIGALLAQRTP
ncbi:PAS domain S-box protein [Candidatus Sumerlaeota bacterium]|nr:PAS domain S-box protein [Candidatus Sumerlaeota bacterium]